MIGRYSDQSDVRSGFSLPSKCFHSDVQYLGSVELTDELHRKLQSSDRRIDLESGFCRQKIFRELFTFHKAVPVTFLITHALQNYARTSRVVRMNCGLGCG